MTDTPDAFRYKARTFCAVPFFRGEPTVAEQPKTLSEKAARQLSNTTKTPPQWRGTTPRWIVQMLPWTPVEAGVYRVNQAKDDDFAATCTPVQGETLPRAFSDYDLQPREYQLT